MVKMETIILVIKDEQKKLVQLHSDVITSVREFAPSLSVDIRARTFDSVVVVFTEDPELEKYLKNKGYDVKKS